MMQGAYKPPNALLSYLIIRTNMVCLQTTQMSNVRLPSPPVNSHSISGTGRSPPPQSVTLIGTMLRLPL